MKQDYFMLLISILLFIAMLVTFANQSIIDKDYERCMDKNIKECSSGELLNNQQCIDYAMHMCREVLK